MKLFVVPTPIGNLKDITIRAVEVLKNVDIILCEDIKKSLILLNHLEIKKQLMSFHKHNEHNVVNGIVKLLKNNNIAIITDAGTPGISDPCYLLIKVCIENNIEIECLPGATAFVPALIKSGIPADKFVFEGFLPTKKKRQSLLLKLSKENRTIIIYESPKRLLKTLNDLLLFFDPKRKICVCREITKLYESYTRGSLEEVASMFKDKVLRGEIVLVIEGFNSKHE